MKKLLPLKCPLCKGVLFNDTIKKCYYCKYCNLSFQLKLNRFFKTEKTYEEQLKERKRKSPLYKFLKEYPT